MTGNHDYLDRQYNIAHWQTMCKRVAQSNSNEIFDPRSHIDRSEYVRTKNEDNLRRWWKQYKQCLIDCFCCQYSDNDKIEHCKDYIGGGNECRSHYVGIEQAIRNNVNGATATAYKENYSAIARVLGWFKKQFGEP